MGFLLTERNKNQTNIPDYFMNCKMYSSETLCSSLLQQNYNLIV